MSLFDRWTGVLDELRGQGRYRSFRLPQGIDFTSNDYLGYGATWEGEAPAEPSEQLRCDHGSAGASPSQSDSLSRSGISSRLLRGHHEVWDEAETMLAAWHGVEAVLMMTSGYTANEGLIATLAEPGDWVAADELSHACIIDGLRLARPRKFLFKHNDLNHLEDGLKNESAKRPVGREMFVITESLFSMDGDTAPIEAMSELTARYGSHLVVDEAHSTGCFGENGARRASKGLLASVHTGGKALGLPGAYICGSRLLKEYLINKCRHLIFTTAMPPAVGSWWLEQIPRVQREQARRTKLHANAALFRNRLAEHGIQPPGSHYVVPVIVGEDPPAVAAAQSLQQLGFDVRAIRPPTVPHGTCRLRISVHANHDDADLIRLANAIAAAVKS